MRAPSLLSWMLIGIIAGTWVQDAAPYRDGPLWLGWGMLCGAVCKLWHGGSGAGLRGWACLAGFALAGVRFHADGEPLTKGNGACMELCVVRVLPDRGGQHRALSRGADGALYLCHSSWPYPPGSKVVSLMDVRSWSAPVHPWDFDERQFWSGRGVRQGWNERFRLSIAPAASTSLAGVLERLRHHVLSRVGQGEGSADGKGLLVGLVTGDKTHMSFRVRQSFAELGLSHLTAVSGFHVGLVMALCFRGLRVVPVRWRWLAVLPPMWMYILLCGAPASALRAGIMASLASLAAFSGRRPDGRTLLSGAGISLWVMAPHLLGDVGTQLSVLATAGILHWHAHRTQDSRGKLRRWAEPWLAIPCVATLATAPVAWPTFGQFPVACLPANLLATPVVMLLVLLVLLSACTPQPASLWFGQWAVILADITLQGVAIASEGLPAQLLPRDSDMLVLAGSICALAIWFGMPRPKGGRWVLCGCALAWALLRWQAGREQTPEVWTTCSGETVVLVDRQVAVVPKAMGPASSMTWKTRSLVERVSSMPPVPWKHSGDRLAWTPFALYMRLEGDTLMWLNSLRSPCGSGCPHRIPKLPCP